MIKYTIFLAVVFGTSVAAFAAIAPQSDRPARSNNTTTIYKNEFWPSATTIVVERCALEDCSDTPQS